MVPAHGVSEVQRGERGGKEGSKGGRWVERLKREAPQQLPIIGGAVPFP